jgi:hypothetical protein
MQKSFRDFVSSLSNIATSDLVFYGGLTLLAHLTLMVANRLLVSRSVSAHVPAEWRWDVEVQLCLGVATGLLVEVMLFFLGWLFITGMSMLLDGKENARALFGWLGLCYLPAVCFSLFSFARNWLTLEDASYAGIAQARSAEQLSTALLEHFSNGAQQWSQMGANVVYLLILALAIEATHRVCNLSRLKALLSVGSYVGLLFTINYFGA